MKSDIAEGDIVYTRVHSQCKSAAPERGSFNVNTAVRQLGPHKSFERCSVCEHT